jgi:hypothetical protein
MAARDPASSLRLGVRMIKELLPHQRGVFITIVDLDEEEKEEERGDLE